MSQVKKLFAGFVCSQSVGTYEATFPEASACAAIRNVRLTAARVKQSAFFVGCLVRSLIITKAFQDVMPPGAKLQAEEVRLYNKRVLCSYIPTPAGFNQLMSMLWCIQWAAWSRNNYSKLPDKCRLALRDSPSVACDDAAV